MKGLQRSSSYPHSHVDSVESLPGIQISAQASATNTPGTTVSSSKSKAKTSSDSTKRAPSFRAMGRQFQSVIQTLDPLRRSTRTQGTTSALPVASPSAESSRHYHTRQKSHTTFANHPTEETKPLLPLIVSREEVPNTTDCPVCFTILDFSPRVEPPDTPEFAPSSDHNSTESSNDPLGNLKRSSDIKRDSSRSSSSTKSADEARRKADHILRGYSDRRAISLTSGCRHCACLGCYRTYLVSMMENYRMNNVTCIVCSESLPFVNIVHVLTSGEDIAYGESLVKKYDNFLLYSSMALEPDVIWCPTGGCGYALIAPDRKDCPMIFCERPSCCTVFCANCKDFWHAGDCVLKEPENLSLVKERSDRKRGSLPRPSWMRRIRNDKRKESRALGSNRVSKSSTNTTREDQRSMSSASRSSKTKALKTNDGDVKNCPRCRSYVLKMDDGTCNHMVCIVCGCEFCWLCMKEITDMHYLSPSGCTFWGRKQWTVEKRILWQLGTFVGAPLGIGFLAMVAVPAIIIGMPFLVGWKVYQKYNTANVHKRRMAAIGGALGSLIISPIVAALAVGIGVPMLLVYIYIITPIALCRGSACGPCMPDPESTTSDDTADHPPSEEVIPEASCSQPVIIPIEEEIELAENVRASGQGDKVLTKSLSDAGEQSTSLDTRIQIKPSSLDDVTLQRNNTKLQVKAEISNQLTSESPSTSVALPESSRHKSETTSDRTTSSSSDNSSTPIKILYSNEEVFSPSRPRQKKWSASLFQSKTKYPET